MSISFGGLASGLPVDSIISQLIALERRPIDLLEQRVASLRLNDAQFQNAGSRATTLQTTLKKLTAQSVIDTNLFQKKKATSSNEAVATATVGKNAAAQTIDLEVLQLATATRAQSQSGVGTLLTGTSALTDVAQGNVTDGTFTIYVNGTASTITVDTSQDVDSVLTQLGGVAGITGASVVGGQIELAFNPGTTVQLGANGDSSNFLDLTFLKTGTQTATSITSSSVLTTLNLSEAVSSAAANFATPVTDGTFTIGTATFDTTGKNLSQIITEINSSPDAGVTAFFNVSQNRLELVSKDSGSALITLADGTSNFLTATGLIVAGNTTTSQTQGQNAQFVLNGSTLFSASNTVSEGVSGIDDVTLNLASTNVGSPITITIGQDSDELKSTLTDFTNQFNQLISFIDEQTNSQSETAQLKGESGLRRFRNQLRTQVSDLVSGLTQFTTLSQVGISTGAVTSGTAAASPTLIFDSTKLDAALAANPAEVEALFIGANGIMTELQALVDQALFDDTGNAGGDGLFASHKTSVDQRIESLNDQISRAEDRLATREAQLRSQFQVMEQLIAQSQAQGSALSGLAAQLAANSGN